MLLFVGFSFAMAQGSVRGKVKDKKNDEALGFVNVVISPRGDTKLVKGAVTDIDGAFNITDLPVGNYTLTLSFVGYKELTRDFAVTAAKPSTHYNVLYMSEDSHQLQEVTVTGQRSSMKLEVDRKSFDVTQDIANAGGAASDVLENIPSVEVDNDGNISLRGNSSVEVWINGRASGLTSDNRAQILQQLPAESIERIEVIDNPSAKFSAEGSAGIIRPATTVPSRLVATRGGVPTPVSTSITTVPSSMPISTSVIVIVRTTAAVATATRSISTPTNTSRTAAVPTTGATTCSRAAD